MILPPVLLRISHTVTLSVHAQGVKQQLLLDVPADYTAVFQQTHFTGLAENKWLPIDSVNLASFSFCCLYSNFVVELLFFRFTYVFLTLEMTDHTIVGLYNGRSFTTFSCPSSGAYS